MLRWSVGDLVVVVAAVQQSTNQSPIMDIDDLKVSVDVAIDKNACQILNTGRTLGPAPRVKRHRVGLI